MRTLFPRVWARERLDVYSGLANVTRNAGPFSEFDEVNLARPRIQLLIRFGYDGSRFHGLQPQKDVPTVGAALRQRLHDAADGEWAKALTYSARTDAGVHCLQNYATCHFPLELDAESIIEDLARDRNDGLIRVSAMHVPYTTHARGGGRGKRYRFVVDDGCPIGSLSVDAPKDAPLFGRGVCWPVTPRLDGDRMRDAGKFLEGTHNFESFRARKCEIKSAVKTLVSVRVGGPFALADGRRRFIIEIVGTAFVRRMIRYIVGTVVEVGAGLRSPSEVGDILAACDRRRQGVCAPARGLTLMAVGFDYPPDGSALLPELAHLESLPTLAACLKSE